VTNAAPVISWTDADPSAQSFTVSRGPNCSSLSLIDGNATSAVTDSLLALDGSDDGSYCYQVQSFDGLDPATSNPIDVGTVTVVLDTVTNTPAFTNPTNGATVHGTVGVTFTNSDASTPVTTHVLARQGSDAFADVGASWDTTAGPDGAWDVKLTAQDHLGNPAASSTVITVTVDNAAPLVTPTFPSSTTWVHGTVSVPYTVSDVTGVASVKLQYDLPGGGTNWVDAVTAGGAASGTLSWTSNLPAPAGGRDGVDAIRVIATDTLGNTAADVDAQSSTVKIDNTAPTAAEFTTLGDPKNGTTYGRGAISVPYTGGSDGGSGVASVALQAQINGTSTWTTKASGASPISWTPAAPDDCTCAFRLLVLDVAGNQSASATPRTLVKIDGFDPVAPTVFSIDRTMTNGPPKLTWSKSASGDVAGYRLVRDTINFPTGGALLLKTQLSYTDNSLPRDGTVDGAHGYQLYAVDQSGNASVAKVANFFLDSVPPTTPTAPTAP